MEIFKMENKDFEIFLLGFGFELKSKRIWTKTNAFYSHYKTKIIHQYKKWMHGDMNVTNNYMESKLI
jgi:hypothetical protein